MATFMQCFNPRTREGATQIPGSPRLFEKVSIHAPVRVRQREEISIKREQRRRLFAPTSLHHDIPHALNFVIGYVKLRFPMTYSNRRTSGEFL